MLCYLDIKVEHCVQRNIKYVWDVWGERTKGEKKNIKIKNYIYVQCYVRFYVRVI